MSWKVYGLLGTFDGENEEEAKEAALDEDGIWIRGPHYNRVIRDPDDLVVEGEIA